LELVVADEPEAESVAAACVVAVEVEPAERICAKGCCARRSAGWSGYSWYKMLSSVSSMSMRLMKGSTCRSSDAARSPSPSPSWCGWGVGGRSRKTEGEKGSGSVASSGVAAMIRWPMVTGSQHRDRVTVSREWHGTAGIESEKWVGQWLSSSCSCLGA